MSQNIKPIQVWGQAGPNPPKVALVLEELKIPYTIVPLPFDKVKDPSYLAINPNGRLPAIIDPNTSITIWESGAILEYLVDTYDKEHLISFPSGSPEYWHARQWLHFQVSGQGPYFGQLGWFKRYHPEPVPSAVARYRAEVERVTSVLQLQLSRQKDLHGTSNNGPWLVSDKKSYADLAFIPWHMICWRLHGQDEMKEDEYPLVKEWMDKMAETEIVQKVWKGAMRENLGTFEGFDKYPRPT